MKVKKLTLSNLFWSGRITLEEKNAILDLETRAEDAERLKNEVASLEEERRRAEAVRLRLGCALEDVVAALMALKVEHRIELAKLRAEIKAHEEGR
jgi:hypothetical protein